MGSLKISQRTPLTGDTLAAGDLIPVVDIDAESAEAQNKSIAAGELADAMARLGDFAASVPAAKKLYVSTAGDDTAGARGRIDLPFLTPAAAVAAASSGDLIHVYPGSYACTATLAKDGVNWHFDAGATVTHTASDTGATWDDGGTAMTFTVTGAGSFVRLDSSANTIAKRFVTCSHADSVIDVTCLDITVGNGATGNGANRAINAVAGTLRVNCRDVTTRGTAGGGTCVWWENGRMSVTGRRATGGNGVYSAVTATPTGDGHARFDEIFSTVYCVYDVSTDTTAAVWVRANIVKQTGGSVGKAVLVAGTGRVYVECQKIFGQIGTTGTGLLYLRSDKVSPSPGSGSATIPLLSAGGGTAWVQVNHWDPTGLTSNVNFASVGGGTTDLIGGNYVGTSASSGVTASGGTIRLRNMRIDTSANSTAGNPAVAAGGTLVLDNCTLVANAGRDSVRASSAQTITNYGSVATTAVNGNVTVNVDPLTVDSNVV